MMQKRTLYISLLLVSCLLFLGFTNASAQTVTFQSKNALRCAETVMNVTVENAGDLSAFEIIFEVSGDYSSMSVDFADGFTGLNNRIGPIADGNIYRLAAMKSDDGFDACVDFTGGVVVAEITFNTADVCTGVIDVIGATVSGGCCDAVAASTGLVGCDPIEALATTIVPGSITMTNQAPTLTCDGNKNVHWGDEVSAQMTFSDGDNESCETLTFAVTTGPGDVDANGLYTWTPTGDDVCDHEVIITVTDKCNASAECTFNVCVENTPPEIAADPEDVLFVVWGITLSDQVIATDADNGPNLLNYTIVSFDGPTDYGTGLTLDAGTGVWSWDIGDATDYLGDFSLCLAVSDGANLCDPCAPTNSDTACYAIHVAGFAVSIEKVHDQLQGHHAQVSIYLDSAFMPDVFSTDLIGGFDFLIAYDASALTATEALPGALIDNDKFEYFTYRFGATGNCDGGCPSGIMRIVALRETNNGVVNTYHITNPGELAVIDFLVSHDYNLECQHTAIRFFWLDCGDNTLSDESGNWLHLGLEVYDYLGLLLTDPAVYGYNGPMGECFDTVYSSEDVFKNAPIGSIIFRNGGVNIICKDVIDDRGDVNLNGIEYEIADAVVFTNYFIVGLNAFTINVEGQMAATEINGDGYALTVADLVYLVRVIVGDAQEMPKANPMAYANFELQGSQLSVDANVELGAALFVFNGRINPTLADASANMELVYGYDGNTTRAFVWSIDGNTMTSGAILNVDGGSLVSVEVAESNGTTIANTSAKLIPVAYELAQNYPNPFNPSTKIELALPIAANWNIGIFNVSGQKVAEFSGYSEAGTIEVNWDASNMASGMYFYRATAGDFTDAKKMILIK